MEDISPSKEIEMLNSLSNYFFDKKPADIMVGILNKSYCNKKISLRIFDWFVTNYCKKNNIVYTIKRKSGEQSFNVFADYHSQLKSFTKHYFDPFNRSTNGSKIIKFIYNSDGDHIMTTLKQLNFFKWAISNKIVKYIVKNFDDIFSDMSEVSQKQKKIAKEYREKMSDTNEESDDKTKKKIRKPRQTLSDNNSNCVSSYKVNVVFNFD